MGRKRKKGRAKSNHVNKYIDKRGKEKSKAKVGNTVADTNQAESDQPDQPNQPDIDNKADIDNKPDTRDIKYGDIWFADLGSHEGTSIQEGDRPVLVISNDINNQRSNTVNIIPFTGKMKRLYMPTHVVVELSDETKGRAGKKGLDRDSVALTEQITTISKSSLFSYIGNIGDSKVMEDINWPSTSNDGEFYYRKLDGETLDADEILSSYEDWRDVSSWPVSERQNKIEAHRLKKQEDPLDIIQHPSCFKFFNNNAN